MSVKSSTFGAVKLTGEEAKKFKAQYTYGRPKKAAVEALARGKSYAEEFDRNGYVVLKKG